MKSVAKDIVQKILWQIVAKDFVAKDIVQIACRKLDPDGSVPSREESVLANCGTSPNVFARQTFEDPFEKVFIELGKLGPGGHLPGTQLSKAQFA